MTTSLAIPADVPFIQDMWSSYFTEHSLDFLLVPTTPISSRPIYDVEPYAEINLLRDHVYDVYARAHTADTQAKIPSISLPIGFASDGMPLGIMFYGRPGEGRRGDWNYSGAALIGCTKVKPEVEAAGWCVAVWK